MWLRQRRASLRGFCQPLTVSYDHYRPSKKSSEFSIQGDVFEPGAHMGTLLFVVALCAYSLKTGRQRPDIKRGVADTLCNLCNLLRNGGAWNLRLMATLYLPCIGNRVCETTRALEEMGLVDAWDASKFLPPLRRNDSVDLHMLLWFVFKSEGRTRNMTDIVRSVVHSVAQRLELVIRGSSLLRDEPLPMINIPDDADTSARILRAQRRGQTRHCEQQVHE